MADYGSDVVDASDEQAGAKQEQPPPSEQAPTKSEGYHYWHDKVPKGDGAAPPPEHKPCAVETLEKRTLPEVTIADYGFMDDEEGGLIKLYIKLEGDLEGVTEDAIDLKVEASKFALNLADLKCSMHLSVCGKTKLHTLHAERLFLPVRHEQCKFRISKKNSKLIVTLCKIENVQWDTLRHSQALPYRRGGGGSSR